MFSKSSAIAKIKPVLMTLVDASDFACKWEAVIAGFRQWEASWEGQNTSTVNVRLEFLRRLDAAFPNSQLRTKEELIDQVLDGSGIKAQGDTIVGQQPDGRRGKAKVLRREATEKFGILYTLETDEGFQFTREFFE